MEQFKAMPPADVPNDSESLQPPEGKGLGSHLDI
ncbi:MAG: hypothetical protein QOF48_810 [Verrucomicrobiota bacterium]